MNIIIGLGNPGQKYHNTRHNFGFICIDVLAQKLQAENFHMHNKCNAYIANANWRGQKIILAKPQTYMNNSGQAVIALMNFYKLLPKTLGIIRKNNADLSQILTVIHDDIDIQFSNYKLQTNCSSAGHNGVRSIIQHLKTQNFQRLRLGIKTDAFKNISAKQLVLSPFMAAELNDIHAICSKANEDLLENIKK